VSWEHVPGYVSEKEAYGETTVMIERGRIADAALHMRDTEGFNMLSDVSAADYLGWGGIGVAGYWGGPAGRDSNAPG
jgi:NADH:ubiquinone oxidoreductase subunit C